jgi:hypothetical protein
MYPNESKQRRTGLKPTLDDPRPFWTLGLPPGNATLSLNL